MYNIQTVNVRNRHRLVANVLEVLEQATDDERSEGLSWYDDAHAEAQRIAADSGLGVNAVAGIIAVLSPRLAWQLNLKAARQLAITGDTSLGLRSNVRKAQRLRNGESPNDVLGGNKVRAFYDLIADPERSVSVCIDRHAFDLATGAPNGSNDKPRKVLERVGIYDLLADAYRIAASRAGLRPHQVQAITWIVWRNRALRARPLEVAA